MLFNTIGYTRDEVEKILERHAKWLAEKYGGEKADFTWANLKGANLKGANLQNMDFSFAYLKDANLSGADLERADFRFADLEGVNLEFAYLQNTNLQSMNLGGANLQGANLQGANLQGARLKGANLRNARLKGANLQGADLRDTDFQDANLRGANLQSARLQGANFKGADTLYAKGLLLTCPEKGAFIAFKKASTEEIIELLITEDAKRSSATGRKCRASKAKVLSITNSDGTASDKESVCSSYDPNFLYKVGEIVEVADFDDDRWNECAPGIHFFITRDEAVNYVG